MRTDDLDFELPTELIAQEPAADRAGSRLLRYRRADQSIAHHQFHDLPRLLRRGDLLVFNDARVLPARFYLRKSSGGIVEGLFLREGPDGAWTVMLKNAGSASGQVMSFAADERVGARVLSKEGEQYRIAIESFGPAALLLERLGRMPLPPYIKRDKQQDQRDALDRERYQTVFARVPGAVASPTAALHFSLPLLAALATAGVERTFVTLHVGLGTFKPVSAERLEDHRMHAERYAIDQEAAGAINRAKREGRRIVAVGTTAARVLESQPAGHPLVAKEDQTDIFIRPPYEWKHVDALITNFHLPRSTLIALVAAMAGLEEQRRLYQIAIEQRYRFFSYGDAMLVE